MIKNTWYRFKDYVYAILITLLITIFIQVKDNTWIDGSFIYFIFLVVILFKNTHCHNN